MMLRKMRLSTEIAKLYVYVGTLGTGEYLSTPPPLTLYICFGEALLYKERGEREGRSLLITGGFYNVMRFTAYSNLGVNVKEKKRGSFDFV